MAGKSNILPVYVVAGKDVFLRTQALQSLREQLLGKEQGLGEVRLDGKGSDLATVLDEVRTLPFLAERKVVIVDDADPFITEYRKELEEYVAAPCPTGSLILISESWRKGTNLDKALVKTGGVIAFEPMKGKVLAGWVGEQASRWGKTLSYDATWELIRTVGTETGRLASEVEKLALYVGSRKAIAVEDVQALSGQTAEEKIFQVCDLMAEGKTRPALEMLNRILEADRSAEFSLVGVLTYSLRRLLKGRLLLDSGLPPREISGACKVIPFLAEQFMGQVRRFSADRLRGLIEELARIDYGNKTGLGPARLNMEKFITCATSSI